MLLKNLRKKKSLNQFANEFDIAFYRNQENVLGDIFIKKTRIGFWSKRIFVGT